MENFEVTVMEVNFIKLAKILLDVLPKYLRTCFTKHWNEKHDNQWNSDEASGKSLVDSIPCEVKNRKPAKDYLEQLSKGNEDNWDTTILVFVMLYSGLELIPGCREKTERTNPLLVSEGIDIIRDKRNTAFAHAGSMSCPSDEFGKVIEELKSAARNAFGKNAETEIN